MRIKITKAEYSDIPFKLKDIDLGIKYITNSKDLYDVIDKRLFFLMVIKYGIEFVEVYTYSISDYFQITTEFTPFINEHNH